MVVKPTPLAATDAVSLVLLDPYAVIVPDYELKPGDFIRSASYFSIPMQL
jgi:hypothetical protein